MSFADALRTECLYIDGNPDYAVPATTLGFMTSAADELDRLTTLETAVRTIIKAVNEYLPPDSGLTEKDFISEVIGAVDNPAVFAALKDRSNRPER